MRRLRRPRRFFAADGWRRRSGRKVPGDAIMLFFLLICATKIPAERRKQCSSLAPAGRSSCFRIAQAAAAGDRRQERRRGILAGSAAGAGSLRGGDCVRWRARRAKSSRGHGTDDAGGGQLLAVQMDESPRAAGGRRAGAYVTTAERLESSGDTLRRRSGEADAATLSGAEFVRAVHAGRGVLLAIRYPQRVVPLVAPLVAPPLAASVCLAARQDRPTLAS